MRWYEDKEYQKMSKALKDVCPEIANDFQLDDMVLCCDGSVRRIEAISDKIYCQFRPDEKNRTGSLWFEPEKLTRLLSQEDLQEMYERYLQKRCDIGEYGFNVAYTFTELEEFLKTFFNLVTAGRIRKGWYPKSWVQFWLAFIMHELYQKKWNPETEKWEKEK